MKRLTAILFSLLLMHSLPGLAGSAEKADQNKPWSYQDRELWQELPHKEIEIGDETYGLTTLPADDQNNRRLYLWINENAWPNNGDATVIQGLTKSGSVWYLDTAEALFIDRSRMRIRGLDGRFVKDLMELASQSYEEIVIVSLDVASVPVLRGLHLWQETAGKSQLKRLKNVVLLYPSLFVNAPAAGEIPELFPISYHSALPITILQPEHGAQANTIGMTAKALKMGGSLVNTIQVPIATDGYYKFQDIRQMAEDAIIRIPAVTDAKIERVKQLNYQVMNLDPLSHEIPQSRIIAGFVKLDEPKAMQAFSLPTLKGDTIQVPESYKGKALLVNFWATWCPHCVEEIPSMNRALKQLDEDRFAMISVSYKDTRETMQEFVKQIQVDFPILMDYDGKVSQQWKVFAYPSSFLIDANGKIHYSINAGSIWDSPEMLSYLREVMEIPYQP